MVFNLNNKKNTHSVLSKASGQWKRIYSIETEIPEIAIAAITPDAKHLMFKSGAENEEALRTMSLINGEVDGPHYGQSDRDIDAILTDDLHREFMAVQISGLLPTFDFADKEIDKSVALVQRS